MVSEIRFLIEEQNTRQKKEMIAKSLIIADKGVSLDKSEGERGMQQCYDDCDYFHTYSVC